jgi:hypothetical protein
MLACPVGLRMLIARLHRVAMAWEPLPVRIWVLSGAQDSDGALPLIMDL